MGGAHLVLVFRKDRRLNSSDMDSFESLAAGWKAMNEGCGCQSAELAQKSRAKCHRKGDWPLNVNVKYALLAVSGIILF